MNKLLTFVLFLSSIAMAGAQGVEVENRIEKIGGGYNSTYRIKIPHTDADRAEKAWRSFLKDNDARVKTSKGEIKGENVVINGLGPDTMQFYSQVLQDEEQGAIVRVAVQGRDGFISPNSNAGKSKSLENLFEDWAKGVAREGLDLKVVQINALFSATNKEREGLGKTNERLDAENKNMQQRIEQNAKTIEANAKRMEELQKLSEEQDGLIKKLKEKYSDLK